MAKDIHLKYYPKAKIKCACGAEFEIGSTQKRMEIEICSQCHPIYTGKKKFIDSAGRMERYKKMVSKSEELKKQTQKKKKKSDKGKKNKD